MVGLLLLAGSLGACAKGAASGTKAGDSGPEPVAPAVDWDNPIHGDLVSSLSEAQQQVKFDIPTRIQELFGGPTKIYVTPPAVAPEDRVMAAIFMTDFGQVIIQQQFPDVPADEYEAQNDRLFAENGDPNLHGSFSFVPLPGDRRGFVTTSPDGRVSDLRWLEGDTEILVRGPSLTLSQCVQVADELLQQD
jgi:hypothetical protein